MHHTSPKFMGERLQQARKARQITQGELGEALGGISVKSISAYEKNENQPSPATIDALCAFFNLPQSFFFTAVRERHPSSTPVFYRSRAASTKKDRDRAEVYLSWFQELVHTICSQVNPPPLSVPFRLNTQNPAHITSQDVERCALQAREHWGLGEEPIGHLCNLLETHGVFISRMSLGSEELNALSVWVMPENVPLIVLNNDRDCYTLSRFDLAHELGHLLLHSGVTQENFNDAALFKVMEEQAHHFARAFLLPFRAFREDAWLSNLDMLRHLKSKWFTSIGAMIFRLHDVGLVTESEMANLWRNYGRRGWRNHEPFDDVWPPEEPDLFREAFEYMTGQLGLSKDMLLRETRLSADLVELLCNLPYGFFPRSSSVEVRGLGLIRFTPKAQLK
ncbi:helix-turn-helix domain-containing protein [Deinococcus roseus]|uniref:Transcriptional regulator n=1 Tax=Deinococcus roseus TaxID=392414 RepID=A0ABQ2DIJ8_9DEIO|nr:XRE family transcriptional regulator [Deinococcus roseus]GGJ58418.1 transcriptional regulator [Deinococcus roseus]